MAILPASATERIMLNAVPENSANRTPASPSITGNPAAKPPAIRMRPEVDMGGHEAKRSRTTPLNINNQESVIIFVGGVFLPLLPRASRLTVNPATYSDREQSALLLVNCR